MVYKFVPGAVTYTFQGALINSSTEYLVTLKLTRASSGHCSGNVTIAGKSNDIHVLDIVVPRFENEEQAMRIKDEKISGLALLVERGAISRESLRAL